MVSQSRNTLKRRLTISFLWNAVASAARHRFGFLWFDSTKAPSLLRSAGALQRLDELDSIAKEARLSCLDSNKKQLRSEPAFLVLDVCADEVFVRLCEVDDSFYQADNGADSTGHQGNNDLNNPFGGVAKDKLMNSESA